MPIILGPSPSLFPTTTIGSMIERAYRILGDLGTGESMTAAQSNDGLDAARSMLDSFSIERLMIYQIVQEPLTWPASTVSRTIGPSGDLVTTRPNRVETGTFFQDSNNIAYPVDIIRNREVYDNIYDKTVQSSYPELVFYDPAHTDGTLYVYPVPNQTLTLYLNTWQPLQTFNHLTDELVLPPGYKRMIEYNLAKELESESGLILAPGALQIAMESKAAVKRLNSLPIVSQTETAYVLHGRGRSDIVAGK